MINSNNDEKRRKLLLSRDDKDFKDEDLAFLSENFERILIKRRKDVIQHAKEREQT